MDGDLVPLKRLVNLCSQVCGDKASIIIDEAHSGGVFGNNGSGYVCERNMENHPRIVARVVTLGKAFGVQGAFVLGSTVLKTYLLNYCRPLIYSTAMAPAYAASVLAAYDLMMQDKNVAAARSNVFFLSEYFHYVLKKAGFQSSSVLQTKYYVTGVLIPGADACLHVATEMQDRGFGVMAVRSPTVSPGKERLRIVIHAYNTAETINRFVQNLAEVVDKVGLARL